MLRFQLKNTILTPATTVSILGLYLFMLVSIYPHPSADLLYNYQYVTQIGYGSYFIPVVTVIPICFFLHNTGSAKGIQFSLIRSKLSVYSSTTLLNAVLSGMAVTFGAFMLFTLTCLVYSPEGPPYWGHGLLEGAYGEDFYSAFFDHPAKLYSIMGAVYTINGAMWPVISLLYFSLIPNQYVVVAIPFILKSLFAFAAQMLDWYYLDPGQLMLFGAVAAELPCGGLPYMVGYIGTVILLCGAVWVIRTYRKVRYA